jgi:hypothetical protein
MADAPERVLYQPGFVDAWRTDLPPERAHIPAVEYIRADAAQFAAPAVKVTPGQIERAVWSAMIWAASNNPGFDGLPEYTDIGNSHAEVEARRAAARILSTMEAVPVAEVWRRAMEAAAQAAGVGTFPIAGMYEDLSPWAKACANECARIQNVIRALPLPDDLK